MVTLEQAKLALGETGKKMSDDDIERLMAVVGHLTDSWMEEYEKTIYDGKTLKQLLQND